MTEGWFLSAGMVLLACLLGATLWRVRHLCAMLKRHRGEMDRWRARLDEICSTMERVQRDTGTLLDKIEDTCAQQVQDWNAVQQEIAVLDGRLGQVERRFGPLAPLEQRVDEAPDTEPDGPRPVEQEAEHD